jgi:hypothetical protein
LELADFPNSRLRRLFEIIVKAQSDKMTIRDSIGSAIQETYQRVIAIDEIGKEFGLSFDYTVFIDRVYQLRLERLRKERPTFEAKEPLKARECAIGIACLQMAQEDLEI